MTDTATDTSSPTYVFGPNGQILGNQTSAQGQQPAAAPPQSAPFAPQSPLATMGPPPAPTPPPQYGSLKIPPAPPVPHMQQIKEPPPDAKDYQKGAMEFASAMAVLGAIAGRFTRQPGGAALGAFAGAVKGWQTGNLQAYETAAKEWEQKTKQTLDNNRTVLEQYKLVLENRKMNIDEQMSQIQLKAAQYHDQMMYDAALSKNYTMVANIYEKNVEFTQKAQVASDNLQLKREAQTEKQQQSATYWMSPQGVAELNAVNPDGTPKYSEAQKAGVKQMIELYAAKQQGHLPRSAPAMAMQKFIQEHPEATAEDITAFRAQAEGQVTAARATAGAEPRSNAATLTQLRKQEASIASFEQTAVANGEMLKELATKVDKSGVPAIERWIRAGRQASGDPEVAQLNAQMQVYKDEVAKIITNPNLTGVLSDQSRREVDAFLGGGASAKQIVAVVDLLRQDMGRREQSIKDQIAATEKRLHGGGETGAAPADSGGWGKAQVVQ